VGIAWRAGVSLVAVSFPLLAGGDLPPLDLPSFPVAAYEASDVGPTFHDRLLPGETLGAGEELTSQNGDYRLILEEDGALVLRTHLGGDLWVAPKKAGPRSSLTLDEWGRLVLLTAGGEPAWLSEGSGDAVEPGVAALAVVQDTGHFVHYLADDAVWHTTRASADPDLVPPAPPATDGGPDEPEPDPGGGSPVFHPFSPDSPWNTAIGSEASFEPADGSRTASFHEGRPVVNRSHWSVVVTQATTDDPLMVVDGVRNGRPFTLHIPADTVATGGNDRHVTVVQPDGRTAFDLYKFERIGSRHARAAFVAVTDLHGSGIVGGTRASGVPAFAGLIRAHELERLDIPHALAVAVPGSALRSGPVWPATRQDDDAATSYSGALPMGSLVALPPDVDVQELPLTPEGLALARALQDYGAYVVDRSDAVSLYCEWTCDAERAERMEEEWRFLHPLTRVVTNNGKDRAGGGGLPRVPARAPAPS
jgi:hypothetical protein